MDTPLDKIREWYISMPHDTQIELSALSFLLHYDNGIKEEYDDEKRNEKFILFMTPTGLDGFEVISRTLFMMNLLDFSLFGRDTEEGWDETLDRNLDTRNSFTEKGMSPDFIDKMLSTWQDRKYHWIGISNVWKETKEKYLNGKELNRYFFTSSMKK